MDEEFESFIVDPNLVDPKLDISGLRTATDTRPELLFDLPEFSGIRVDPTRGSYIEDMYRAYSGQIPMLDIETPAAAVPPATGGGGSGDGGQATTPIDDFNKQEFEQNLVDQGVGLQIAPDQPVVAPGEMPVTNLEMAIYNDPNLGVVDVDGEGEFGGLINGTDPDRIQANEFADIESPTGIGPTYDEAGLPDTSIPDRNRGQIPTSADEFDVTTDQFTRPTMADIAGPSDFTGAPITIQQTVMDGQPIDPEYDIEAIPITTGAPPNIVMAKDPEGVVDPFDGKYTMSTAITPKDTEQSITQKVADFLGVDASKINKAAVTGALNLVAGKALDTVIPIATVFNLVTDSFTKSPETPEDTSDTTPTTGVNPFADIDTGVGEFDTTPPVDEFSDEEFMVGDTSTAAPTGGDSGADSFFDAVDKSVTGTTKPGTKTEPTYQDAIMRGQTGGGSDSGGSSNGGGKIVCTMMNESYGFGSFRNKIWMKFHKDLSPEYQRGYHKLFLPLVKIAKKNMVVKKILEHIAVHSTIDMRQSMRGKTHLLGRIYRKILLPLCYWVGKNG